MTKTRSFKRALALLLCIVMFVTLLPSFAFAAPATPKLVSAEASGNGIKVTWNAVSGAVSYRVYRKTGSTGWAGIGNATATSYQDNTAAKNTTYTYTVRALDSGGNLSDFDKNGVSGAWNEGTAGYIATPKLVSAKAEGSAIRVKWNKVSGAAGYRIFRKTGSGGWAGLVSVGNVDNYLDTSAQKNTTYTYTVRCLNSSNSVISNFDTNGVSASWAPATGLATPKLINATPEGSGIRVNWNAVSGAASYRVYRKTASTNWVGRQCHRHQLSGQHRRVGYDLYLHRALPQQRRRFGQQL